MKAWGGRDGGKVGGDLVEMERFESCLRHCAKRKKKRGLQMIDSNLLPFLLLLSQFDHVYHLMVGVPRSDSLSLYLQLMLPLAK